VLSEHLKNAFVTSRKGCGGKEASSAVLLLKVRGTYDYTGVKFR
jgi:hypothetical protein